MNDVRPLLWVSDSALERLRLAVQQRVDQWAQSWGLPNTDPARVALWHHGDDAVSADLATAEGLPPAWASALSKTLFKGSGMRSAIVGPVLTDCHEQLRAAACPPPAEPSLAASPGHGHAGARVTLTLLGQQWVVQWTVAAMQMAGYLARPAPGPVAAWSAEATLAPLQVDLKAVIGQAEVDVLGLLNLAPGDVIVLRQRLDDPIHVQGEGTPLNLLAHLGTLQGHVAMQWVAGRSA